MKAPPFDLPGVDGKRHSPATRARRQGPGGDVHLQPLPVREEVDRPHRARLQGAGAEGVGSIAVMSNDPAYNPEDSFDNMKRVARAKGFPFPYVIDETQDVARAYGTVCTPDFFGFDASLELHYHGRFEELVQAMNGSPNRQRSRSNRPRSAARSSGRSRSYQLLIFMIRTAG